MFWHNLRVECGRPRIETVSDIMRRTRVKYHYVIRSVKRNKDEIIRVRFAEALLSDNDRDFFRGLTNYAVINYPAVTWFMTVTLMLT